MIHSITLSILNNHHSIDLTTPATINTIGSIRLTVWSITNIHKSIDSAHSPIDLAHSPIDLAHSPIELAHPPTHSSTWSTPFTIDTTNPSIRSVIATNPTNQPIDPTNQPIDLFSNSTIQSTTNKIHWYY